LSQNAFDQLPFDSLILIFRRQKLTWIKTNCFSTLAPCVIDRVYHGYNLIISYCVAHSPRLLTPSDITSKHDTTPLLSPADILASTSSSATSAAAEVATNTMEERAALDASNTDSLTNLLTDSRDVEHTSLADVSLSAEEQGGREFISAETLPSTPDSENEVKPKPVNITGGISVLEIKDSVSPEGLTSGEMPQHSACEDEEEPSEEDRKKSFDDIMKLLHVDKMPETVSLQPQTFKEFQDIITYPEKMQEEIKRVEKLAQELPDLGDEAVASTGKNVLENSSKVDNSEGDIEHAGHGENVLAVAGEGGVKPEAAAGITEDTDLGGVHSAADEEVKTGGAAPDDQSQSNSTADLDKTLSSGSESRVDANAEGKQSTSGEVPGPETQLGTPPGVHQERSEDLDSSEKQEAAVAVAMPEAHGVQGVESSETCAAMKSSEVKLTMPCALSDDHFLDNQPLMDDNQPIPTKQPKSEAPPTKESTTEALPSGATVIEAPPTNTAPPTEILIVETPPPGTPPTEATPSGAPPTTPSHQDSQKTKTKRARKRAKKNKKEVNAVDIVEVEDR